jgi:hypothetical protein
MPEETDSSKTQLDLQKTADFVSRYANHIRFEPTVFDLKIIFGESDVSSTPHETVFQHTAITVTWAEAKLALWYLLVQLIVQESENGAIIIPPKQIPQELPPLASPLQRNESAKRAHDIVKKYREILLPMMTSKPIS